MEPIDTISEVLIGALHNIHCETCRRKGICELNVNGCNAWSISKEYSGVLAGQILTALIENIIDKKKKEYGEG